LFSPLLTDKGNPRAKASFALNHWVSMAASSGGYELSTGTVEDVDDSATAGQHDFVNREGEAD